MAELILATQWKSYSVLGSRSEIVAECVSDEKTCSPTPEIVKTYDSAFAIGAQCTIRDVERIWSNQRSVPIGAKNKSL